jgi:predicted RNase H-like HicB family nuclease
MRVLSYRILLREEPEGGYTATVPSLPGCVTFGSNLDEAVANAREAIELYVESLKAHGDEVPTEEKREDLPKGTCAEILRQAGLTREELSDLL